MLVMILGMLVYCGRLAWSLALSNEVQTPSLPMLVEGDPGAVEKLFRSLGEPWCGTRSLGLEARAGRLLLIPERDEDFFVRRAQLVKLVDELEGRFATEGSYPRQMERSGWEYSSDGEEFQLAAAGQSFDLTYDSRTGLSTRSPEPPIPEAALLTSDDTSWLPWMRPSVELVGLTASEETLSQFALAARQGPAATPLRVVARTEALPQPARERLSEYSHLQVEGDPFTRTWSVTAFHQQPAPWVEPKALPSVRAESAVWLVGNSAFLERLGLQPEGARGLVTFYDDGPVCSDTAWRTFQSIAAGRLSGTGAGEPQAVSAALASLGELPGEAAAAGSFLWTDQQGQRWRWTWAAGSGARSDWLVAAARAAAGALVRTPPTCGPDTEALHTLRSTVPAAQNEGERRLSFTE